MVTKNAIFRDDPGATYTADVESLDGQTIIQAGIDVTEPVSGTYSVPVTSVVASSLTTYVIKIKIGGSMVGYFFVDMQETAGNYYEQIPPTALQIATQVGSGGGGGGVVSIGGVTAEGAEALQDALAGHPIAPSPPKLPEIIECIRGDTLEHLFESLGSLTGWSKIKFTAKKNGSDLDSAAKLQVIAVAAGGGGLTIVNGSIAPDASLGSLSITDSNAGDIDLTVAASVMKTLSVQNWIWDLQIEYSSGRVYSPIINGQFKIQLDITQENG